MAAPCRGRFSYRAVCVAQVEHDTRARRLTVSAVIEETLPVPQQAEGKAQEH